MELWENLIRTSSALAFVLALMVLLALLFRRFLSGQSMAQGAGPMVRVLGTGYLGPRKSIAVVSVAGEILIVGTTATHLVPLARIKDPERVERLLGKPARAPRERDRDDRATPSRPSRSEWLTRAFKAFEDEGVWRVSADPPGPHGPKGRPLGWLARRLAFLEQKARANVKLPRQPVDLRKAVRPRERGVST